MDKILKKLVAFASLFVAVFFIQAILFTGASNVYGYCAGDYPGQNECQAMGCSPCSNGCCVSAPPTGTGGNGTGGTTTYSGPPTPVGSPYTPPPNNACAGCACCNSSGTGCAACSGGGPGIIRRIIHINHGNNAIGNSPSCGNYIFPYTFSVVNMPGASVTGGCGTYVITRPNAQPGEMYTWNYRVTAPPNYDYSTVDASSETYGTQIKFQNFRNTSTVNFNYNTLQDGNTSFYLPLPRYICQPTRTHVYYKRGNNTANWTEITSANQLIDDTNGAPIFFATAVTRTNNTELHPLDIVNYVNGKIDYVRDNGDPIADLTNINADQAYRWDYPFTGTRRYRAVFTKSSNNHPWCSSVSPYFDLRAPVCEAPTAPRRLEAVEDSRGSGYYTFTWNAPANGTAPFMYRFNITGPSGFSRNVNPATSGYQLPVRLLAGQTYNWSVTPTSTACSLTGPAAVSTFVVPCTTPTAPLGLNAVQDVRGAGYYTFSWNPPAAGTGPLTYSLNITGPGVNQTVNPSTSPYQLPTQLQPGQTYNWNVRATSTTCSSTGPAAVSTEVVACYGRTVQVNDSDPSCAGKTGLITKQVTSSVPAGANINPFASNVAVPINSNTSYNLAFGSTGTFTVAPTNAVVASQCTGNQIINLTCTNFISWFETTRGDVTAKTTLDDRNVPAGSFVAGGLLNNPGIVFAQTLQAISGGGKFSAQGGGQGWSLAATPNPDLTKIQYATALSNALEYGGLRDINEVCSAVGRTVTVAAKSVQYICYVTGSPTLSGAGSNTLVLVPSGPRNVTLNSFPTDGTKVMLLVDGNLNFSSDNNMSNTTGLMAIASGNVDFTGRSVVNGAFIGSTINTGNTPTSLFNSRGMLLGRTGVTLNRYLNNAVGERVDYDPRYLVWFRDFMGKPSIKWQQLTAK